MTPEIRAKIIPKLKSFIYGFSRRNASKAPKGSAIPERKVYLSSFEIVSCLKIYRHSNRDSFWNIVHCNGYCNRYSQCHIFITCHKSSNPFRKIRATESIAIVETNPTRKRIPCFFPSPSSSGSWGTNLSKRAACYITPAKRSRTSATIPNLYPPYCVRRAFALGSR